MDREVEEIKAKIPLFPWRCVVCKEDRSTKLSLCLSCFQVACHVHREHDDHEYRVTMFSAPCGCRAQEGDYVNEPRINFCPKHAAVDKMLAALKAVRRGLNEQQGDGTLWATYGPLLRSAILEAEQS